MLTINNLHQLETCLNSMETGCFLIPVDSLLCENLLKIDKKCLYEYYCDNGSVIQFHVRDNIIIKKTYHIIDDFDNLILHRDTLPASINYLNSGHIFLLNWHTNGNHRRDNDLKPITVKYLYRVSDSLDIDENPESVQFNYTGWSDLIMVRYITFNLTANKINNLNIIYKRQTYFENNIQEVFPFIFETKFEDCYDLSINVFSKQNLDLVEIIKY